MVDETGELGYIFTLFYTYTCEGLKCNLVTFLHFFTFLYGEGLE
jgi:hypothetical protein